VPERAENFSASDAMICLPVIIEFRSAYPRNGVGDRKEKLL